MMTLTLGYRSDGRVITTSGAENPHIFIDGISGSGKSFALKRLAEEAVHQGTLVIAFDYTGDYAEYLPSDALRCQRMDIIGGELRINPLSPTSGTLAVVRAQRLVNLLLAASRLGNQTCLDLSGAIIRYLESGPKTPNIIGLVEYIENAGSITKGMESALKRLKSLSYLITNGPEEINVNLNSPRLLIFEFTQVESDWIRRLMVEVLLRVIWDSRTSIPVNNPPPLVLLLDECQNLNWQRDGMPVRILREGRKFNIGGWFASQWVENERAKTALREASVQMHFRQDQDTATKLARTLAVRDLKKRERYVQLICSLRRGDFLTGNPRCGVYVGHIMNCSTTM